ncbi:MAG TPA: AMP-binding protein [Acidimicrobiales bacterium]|nr:AMP-binding protein [Acidimicrobiales bacterium]
MLPYADVWEAIAEVRGDAPAEIQGSRRISWRDFDRRADGIAQTLLDVGATHQDKVANYLFNAPEYLEAFYGTVKAGLVPVNTNYRYGPSELAYLWDNADAVAVVFHGAFTATVEQVRPLVPRVRLWLWVDDGSGSCPDWAVPYEQAAGAATATVVPRWGRSPDDLILVYTGGTTGMPKGVMWRQGDLGQGPRPDETVESIVAALPDEPSVYLPACPLMHATALMTSLGNKRGGGTIVTLEGRNFDPVELLDTVDRERVAWFAMVGDAFGKPILKALDEHPGRWTLESLRAIFSSGVMWSEATKQGLLRHKASLSLLDSLGSSEAPGLANAASSTDGGVASTATFQPGPHTKVITDDGRFVEAGSGEIGMLGRSGSIPVGYYKDPEKSAATFRLIDGVRFTIPGDWATVEADGSIRLLGRGSVCINTGGEKVFPEEVEEVLKGHPSVHDAVVVGVPDEKWGEAIVAMVEPGSGPEVAEDALIGHVKARLARFKAPKHVLFVATIGRAANGKVDYGRLRREAVERLGAPA